MPLAVVWLFFCKGPPRKRLESPALQITLFSDTDSSSSRLKSLGMGNPQSSFLSDLIKAFLRGCWDAPASFLHPIRTVRSVCSGICRGH